jgi:hypothetical protein
MSEDQKIFVRRVQLALKVLELSLAIVCVGLIVDPINHKMQLNMHHVALVAVAYTGYIIINSVAVVGQMKAERMPQLMVGNKCYKALVFVVVHSGFRRTKTSGS